MSTLGAKTVQEMSGLREFATPPISAVSSMILISGIREDTTNVRCPFPSKEVCSYFIIPNASIRDAHQFVATLKRLPGP